VTNPFSLHGRRALVTGANTGIGQAIAMGLVDAGAKVVCAGRSARDETVDRITKAGGTATLCHVDFADPMAAQGMLADQNFDILINNTGIITKSDAVEATEADWIPLWM
jgi:2-dehydro-3-deoxy-D-gluconate 5-dehydrogenase